MTMFHDLKLRKVKLEVKHFLKAAVHLFWFMGVNYLARDRTQRVDIELVFVMVSFCFKKIGKFLSN